MQNRSLLAQIDWVVVIIYLILVAIGFMNIYAVEYDEARKLFFNLSTSYTKQLIWIGISLILAAMVLIIDARFFSAFAYVFYFLSMLLLVLTLVLGKQVAGSKSWIQIGGFSLQTAELAKFATVLAIARFVNTYGVEIRKLKDAVLAFLLIFLPAWC